MQRFLQLVHCNWIRIRTLYKSLVRQIHRGRVTGFSTIPCSCCVHLGVSGKTSEMLSNLLLRLFLWCFMHVLCVIEGKKINAAANDLAGILLLLLTLCFQEREFFAVSEKEKKTTWLCFVLPFHVQCTWFSRELYRAHELCRQC